MTDISSLALPSNFAEPHSLAHADKRASVLVGFSGGADSSALLHLLARYSGQCGCKLYAAHVNHGIRGAEADRDENFCRAVAKELGVELFVLRADVPKIAKESGESIETAARNVRYGFFARIMRENSIPILATAHNANDNLETMLFNLARGTGLDGLCGIPRSRECEGGVLVRPILGMTRQEILSYCESNSLSFVTDSTNADEEYTRNKIRARALPALTEVNAAAIENASRAARLLNADAEFLRCEAEVFLEKNFKKELSSGVISLTALQNAPLPIASRAIIKAFDTLFSAALSSEHTESILRLAERAVPHSKIELPMNAEAVIEDGLVLRTREKNEDVEPYELALSEPQTLVSQTNCEIFIGISQKKINIYKSAILLYIDFDKIKGELRIRSRREGDRILERGMHKSLKKLACDRKIPLDIRNRLPVFFDDDGIVAVPSLAVRDGVFIRPEEAAKRNIQPLQIYLY